MSIKDVIKSSVYDSFTSGTGLSVPETLFILLVACIIGLYIFIIYRFFSKSAYYSKDLNVTLAGMCVVVSAIMIAMQSNLLVSLGMVGALSIVRFRTAVKNPIDLLYLFWSISAGIIVGVGLSILGILLCAIMTWLIWGLNLLPTTKAPILLIIRTEIDAGFEEIDSIIKDCCSFVNQDSMTIKNNENESVYEIKTKNKVELVQKLYALDGVKAVDCLEYDGEVRQ